MKFYRYFNAGEKGIKRFSNTEFTSTEVRDALLKDNGRYFYLPTYQDRGRDFRPLYYPCKGIETVEQLEEFLRPKENTFVWDNDEWKLKIHTPEQLLNFYYTLMDSNRETNHFIQNIEHIKKCSQEYDISSLNELNDFISKDASAYRIGIYQGELMYFQMEQIEKTGGILISKNLKYEFLEEPCEHFDITCVSNTMDFPLDAPEDFIER